MNKFVVWGSKGYVNDYSPTEVINQHIWGQNMGNMLFYGSVYNTINDGENNIISDNVSIESINNSDYFLLPQANLFYKYFINNIENHIERFKQITVPSVIVGIGYQSSVGGTSLSEEDPRLNEAVRRFGAEVLKHSASIGVRGRITKDYLMGLGFAESDVDIIGDPSIRFFGGKFNTELREYKAFDPKFKIAVNYTPSRYNKKWGELINSIFDNYDNSFAILQDTYEFHPLKWKYEGLLLPEVPASVKKANIPVMSGSKIHKENRARFFTDPKSWFTSLATFDFSIGTRIHGNIAAILSGTPAMTIAIDTRTLELAKYFKMPYIKLEDITADTTVEQLYNQAVREMPVFYSNYNNVLRDYEKFFKKNDIPVNNDFFKK
ncbi:polysaccharide pyruvyl transferase family protein [Leuconostoc carnosum]|uniref:polysaccharide pyruvyl transferase family protein n=1 Tax=Leuconostoc carnosum TaxID=1252 RepID=UPI00123BCEC1|nr:polysaccharide pyruvyl transferase family protein [Leuconostoc carnosum]KAA8375838.1 polysaccharide pyruvyl transferase family protein [Leuconostoc carnosum]KAA8378502.1 polysaccharide pyruvyl transferase family protein [Leuconostoc carnosum]